MQKYYFYLEPFTFVFLQKEGFLIYNSVTYRSKKFKSSKELQNIISQLIEMKNMFCVELTEKEINTKEVEELITFIRDSFSGDLINTTMIKRPAIFPPILKLQYSIDRLKSTVFRHIGEEIINLLMEISIYIGGNNPESSLNSIDVFKQFDYCKKSDNKYLPISKLKVLFNSLKNFNLQTLNVIGGNVLTYPDLDILIGEVKKFSFNTYFYLTYRDIGTDLKLLPLLQYSRLHLMVLIDFPVNTKILDSVIHFLLKNNYDFNFLFAITSADEYTQANTVIQKYNVVHYEIKPVFTGDNIDFFKDNVYLCEEDMQQVQLSRRQIFINQSLNIFNFGKFRIMTNGLVYSGLIGSSIGTINTPLITLLNKEMENSKSWLKIRNHKPCNTCVYQWLCPSPSGYELAIGKPNLCHISI